MNKENFEDYYLHVLDAIDRLDKLLKPIVSMPFDEGKDPSEWIKKVDISINELIVKENVNELLNSILNTYLEMNEEQRSMIRELFKEYSSFSWAAYISEEGLNEEEFFFRKLLLFSMDDYDDTRDIILNLDGFCKEAREKRINYGPILKKIANLSSDIDHYGMGSMKKLLLERS